MNKAEREISGAMLNKYGEDVQKLHFHEEIGEVMTAISHHRRGRIGNFAVLGELSDLQILLNQMIVLYDNSDSFGQIYEGKLQYVRDLAKEAPIEFPTYHLKMTTTGDIEILSSEDIEYLTDYNIVVQKIGGDYELWRPYDGTEYDSWCISARSEYEAFDDVIRRIASHERLRDADITYYLELMDDE